MIRTRTLDSKGQKRIFKNFIQLNFFYMRVFLFVSFALLILSYQGRENVQKDWGLVCHGHARCGTELSTRLLLDHVLSFMLSQTKFSVFGSLNEFKILTRLQEQ